MIMRLDSSLRVELDDAWDFKRFSVLVELPPADLVPVQAALDGLASLPDLETAWVVEAPLRKLDEIANNVVWQEKLSAMIEMAKPYGWFDDAVGAIKAHVMWQPKSGNV